MERDPEPAPVSQVFRRGDTDVAVAEVRSMLARLGLLPGSAGAELTVAGVAEFDDETERAVRAFQQQRGLSADGVVGPATYRALDEAHWRLGDRILAFVPARLIAGDDVVVLQRRLLDMGFDCGRADGLFGAETEQALREFQRNVGIAADGTCGPVTLKALTQLARTVVGGRPAALRESEAINQAGPTMSGKLVILDPGHGGADTGVTGHGLVEADVVYDLASRIVGRLTATGSAAYLTRGPEGGGDEVDRASFANGAGADLVISLHIDAHANPAASGASTYFFGSTASITTEDESGHASTRSSVGARFADLVQRELCARTGLVDLHLHPKTWDLLRRTRMPAVRIEIGYVTNMKDAESLAQPAFRDSVSEAVVAAVQRLYLPPGEDADTGVLRIPGLRSPAAG